MIEKKITGNNSSRTICPGGRCVGSALIGGEEAGKVKRREKKWPITDSLWRDGKKWFGLPVYSFFFDGTRTFSLLTGFI